MARAKTEKKLVSFVRGTLVNKLIRDRAEIENRSESAVIEDIIITNILPEQKDAKFITENYLYSEDGQIGKTLEALFVFNSAGIGKKTWSSKYDNFYELVKFSMTESILFNRTTLEGDERELPHLMLQLSALIDEIKNETEKKYGRMLLDEMGITPQSTIIGDLYELITNNWNDLKGRSITYRLLADMVRIESSWRDTADARTKLLSIIKNMSREW
jgi:hypothetical protein